MPIIFVGIYYVSQIAKTGWWQFFINMIPLFYIYIDIFKAALKSRQLFDSGQKAKFSLNIQFKKSFLNLLVFIFLQIITSQLSAQNVFDVAISKTFFSFLYAMLKLFEIAIYKLIVELNKSKKG